MLVVSDGRRKNRSKTRVKTKERIVGYFTKHPGATKTECAEALGLSWLTIHNHLKVIQNGE